MGAARLLFVTGKGGVGKTTVAAALAQHAAEHGQRVLVIETASDGSLAQLFGHRKLSTVPRRLQAGVEAVHVDARQLVEEYFSRLLRFRWLSDRLLSSNTFNALTAAAPGVTEFLLLEKMLDWIEPGLTVRRRGYDMIIVDGPATGHAVKLLSTPRRIAAMVPGGPLGKTARRLLALLGDHRRTQVVLVSLPEEMAVREAIETQHALTVDLALHVARPIINRIFPRHFSAAEAERIEHDTSLPEGPVRAAARFVIACRREADRHIGQLRRALGVSPILLRQLFAAEVHAGDLRPFGRTLGRTILA
ncbi:MAG TPA: ArsA family ATPase [Candidatus Margulisiibacteriota bacterium]|nr:ArsA family ATPase [Candidatus Margulisiibacteriota bacterium]